MPTLILNGAALTPCARPPALGLGLHSILGLRRSRTPLRFVEATLVVSFALGARQIIQATAREASIAVRFVCEVAASLLRVAGAVLRLRFIKSPLLVVE